MSRAAVAVVDMSAQRETISGVCVTESNGRWPDS